MRKLTWLLALAVVVFGLSGPNVVLCKVDVAQQDVQKLIGQLRAPDPVERCRAAFVLREMGRKAAPAIKALVAVLTDERAATSDQIYPDPSRNSYWETSPAKEASWALAAIGDQAVEPLASALRGGSLTMLCKRAADALAQIDNKHSRGVLKQELRGANPVVRAAVARALGKAPSLPSALLTGALKDRNPQVRRAAVQGLQYIGSQKKGKAAISALLAAFPDRDASVRAASVYAFSYFEAVTLPAGTAKRLLGVLDDPVADVRTQAAYSLGCLHVHSAVGPLISHLSDSDKHVRSKISWALRTLTGHRLGGDRRYLYMGQGSFRAPVGVFCRLDAMDSQRHLVSCDSFIFCRHLRLYFQPCSGRK